MSLHVVILAAGAGTRMCSSVSKVMHQLAGAPMIAHVLHTVRQLPVEQIHVVIPPNQTALEAFLQQASVSMVYQPKPLGTGDAAAKALAFIPDQADVLILYADTPLVSIQSLTQLCQHNIASNLVILTTCLDNPFGYGRILREQEQIVGIVEEKDANSQQKSIREINTGILRAPRRALKAWLSRLENHNAQGEFYLTDIVAMAVADGIPVCGVQAQDAQAVQGVNTRAQLACLERIYQNKQAMQLMAQGVSFADPQRVDIRGTLKVAQDIFVDINVIFQGHNEIAENVVIGAGCVIKNCRIAQGVEIHPYSVLEGVDIGECASIGPFSRVRAHTKIDPKARIGNFVEVKNTHIGQGSKANHLTYLGDASIGQDCNIGAGVITCNYDGLNKHPTHIGDQVFVGSGVQIVAPCRIDEGATIGAGTTLTKDVPRQTLALSRVAQHHVPDWKHTPKSPDSK